ncbi:MAG: TonB family protein [Gammaproteobacteria bacterium]|nr:TonB family protein [Gammaproteobacteria bacterium]
MALDQFKTQVLLLHSERRILDALSSDFGDHYTVHCATSGSEALNTLGETPINVIISAQDLPGMSGVEALREAKKRSPETVGILLAGSADTDVEALVGADEVFEVVRGNVTGDSLTQLVDQATQQMRLITLAESANDTTASIDDSPEHIVMETSDNGSTIVTGTHGRLEAIDPEEAAADAAVGTQSIDILVLTKDGDFLTTVKQSSRGMHNVHHGTTLKQANDVIREHKVGVAVIDAALVGEKVEQLTLHLRRRSSRLVAIVAGRRDDGEMLMDLINRGRVYRFLLKPVSPGRARLAIEASVRHHLEAPDAAFRIEGEPAAKARPKKPPRPAAPPPAPAPAPAPQSSANVAPMQGAEPADPPLGSSDESSPIDEGLSAAFGGSDTSLKETVADLINTLGDALKGKNDEPTTATEDAPVGTQAATEADSGGLRVGKLLILGVAVAGVAAVAGGLYWLTSGDQPVPAAISPADSRVNAQVTETAVSREREAEPVAEPVAESVAAPVAESVAAPAVESGIAPAVEPVIDVQALLTQARLARDAGQIYSPAGANAIELFAAAVEADPSNDIAAVELDAVIEDALAMAEASLLQSRSDEAAAALRRVARADPDNTRLPFLTAQLSQVQLRTYLAGARIAMRDGRFEDAANLLGAATELDIADRSEIEALAAELGVARSDQRAEEVLSLASARLAEGALLTPPNDNARYFYELVLANDSSNTVARQGLTAVASRLVLQARDEIDAGNLDDAEDLLASARAVDARSSALPAAQSALVAAREAIAARDRRATEERRRVEAERAAEERRAAERRAEEERRAAAQAAAAQTASAEQVASAAQTDPGSQPIAPPAGSADVPAQETVSMSSLARTRYVAPKYPRAAERRGASGWVDVLFTVTVDGTVRDVEVRDSSPQGTFDKAAIRAVEKWAFEPVVEAGEVVDKRAGVRMMFAYEN